MMINQNHPPNSLINMIRKKYNSCDGGISNKISKIIPGYYLESKLILSQIQNLIKLLAWYERDAFIIINRRGYVFTIVRSHHSNAERKIFLAALLLLFPNKEK